MNGLRLALAPLVMCVALLIGCAPVIEITSTATVVPASPVYTAPPEPSITPTPAGLVIQPTETPFDPAPAPTSTPYTYRAHYQAFERGFMAHAEDSTCAYVFTFTAEGGQIVIPGTERAEPFGEYHYCTEFTELPPARLDDLPPAGLLLPSDPFDRLWSSYAEMQEAVGYARSADEWYTVTVYPSSAPVGFSGAPWQSPVISLPDGRILMCGFRAATAGSCSLS